ncbi:GTPase ObgE [Chloroflexota bacterium]
MIDRVQVYVKAGDGGNGIISFRREKFVPFGGPDGGNGGRGGSVFLIGDQNDSTLSHLRYRKHIRARKGGSGQGKDMQGKHGEDIVVRVPLGTIVGCVQADGKVEVIGDIISAGQKELVARGGKGGWGNAHFATSVDQAPRKATEGELGEEKTLQLDLKLIADIGIIGHPNVGKSTLLRAVTSATPEVADYPFTTTEPVLGVVERGYQSFVLADIPGLIEGAHEGRGLGLDFLRHIERTRVLIHVIDGVLPNPLTDLRKIEAELSLYDPGLKERPRVIAINKIDLPQVRDRRSGLEAELGELNAPVFFISAATGEGVQELMNKALELISRSGITLRQKDSVEYKVFRPRPLSPRKPRQQRGSDD